ncbi:MAG: hypothetical protein Kow0029_19660 [Candidatus Rifleibacteriota bacterium]
MNRQNRRFSSEFINQAVELNSQYLELRIMTETEGLIPFENLIRELREGTANPENLPEIMQKIRLIMRLKNELELTKKLANYISSAIL